MKVSLKICAILATTTAIIEFATANNAKFLATKPDFLTPCHTSDSNFNKCFAKNFQVIFQEWSDGIPGYESFTTIDPIHVKRVEISQDPKNPLALNTELRNVVITGASNMVIKEARFNAKTLVSQIKMFSPKLHFDCDYKLNGRILNLALNGNGKAVFDIENMNLFLNIQLKLRDEYGYTFADIEKLKLEIGDVGGFKVYFHNLYNGDKVLGESTNAVFNENWRDFYEVLHPAISQAMEAVMKDRLSRAYSYVPGNYVIEDIPSAAEYKG